MNLTEQTQIQKNTYRCIIWVVSGHSGCRFSGQFIELASGDAFVDSGTDFLRHKHGVTVLSAEAVTQLLQPRRYFVKMNRFLPPVSLDHVHSET